MKSDPIAANEVGEQTPDSIVKVLISESVTPHYFARSEDWTHRLDDPGTDPTRILAAYSFAGDFLGEVVEAEQLIEHGITHFEKRTKESCGCSIGFSPRKKKWYGWSHRAIHGFGIGDTAADGLAKIKTFDEAKSAACEFAASVS